MHGMITEMITALAIAADLTCGFIGQQRSITALRAQPSRAQQPMESVSAGVRAFPGIYVRDDG